MRHACIIYPIALAVNVEVNVVSGILRRELSKGYLQLHTIRELAKKYKMNRPGIQRFLEEAGFEILQSGKMRKIRDHIFNKKHKLQISDELHEIIVGSYELCR